MILVAVEATTVRVAPSGPLLKGFLHRPDGAGASASVAGVVVAHPHPLQGGDMESPVVRTLADEIARRGLLALRFDFRHARGSVDVDARALVADSTADLAAAIANLHARLAPGSAFRRTSDRDVSGMRERNVAGGRVALAGYSFGALVALRVAGAGGIAGVAAVGLPVKLERERAVVPWSEVAKSSPPCLVLQGQFDELGTPEAARAFLAERGVTADVRAVPNASHGYFGAEAQVAKIAAGYLAKRLA